MDNLAKQTPAAGVDNEPVPPTEYVRRLREEAKNWRLALNEQRGENVSLKTALEETTTQNGNLSTELNKLRIENTRLKIGIILAEAGVLAVKTRGDA